jgi:hypothetical protein
MKEMWKLSEPKCNYLCQPPVKTKTKTNKQKNVENSKKVAKEGLLCTNNYYKDSARQQPCTKAKATSHTKYLYKDIWLTPVCSTLA